LTFPPAPLAVRWRREETTTQTATLSESAVATLRLHVEGEKTPAPERNLAAYRWTYHGWHRRFELLAGAKEAV
jgi:hypothetical protein